VIKNTLLLMMSALFPCAPGLEAQSPEAADAIRALRSASNAAIARHDAEAVLSFLEADYVITDSTGHIERGLEGNAQSWAKHFADFPDVVYVRTPVKVRVSTALPHAMESGTWVGTRTAGGRQEKGGEYSAVWRKVEGVWKIHSEIFVALYCRGEGC